MTNNTKIGGARQYSYGWNQEQAVTVSVFDAIAAVAVNDNAKAAIILFINLSPKI